MRNRQEARGAGGGSKEEVEHEVEAVTKAETGVERGRQGGLGPVWTLEGVEQRRDMSCIHSFKSIALATRCKAN